MKRTQVDSVDNIDYLIGWLCGAVFLAAPVVALVYSLRRRHRPAIQAVIIGASSFIIVVGARTLMLASGVQHKRLAWIGVNALVLLVLPLLATGIVSGIAWPRVARRPREHRTL